MIKRVLLLLSLIVIFGSCASKEKLVYYHNNTKGGNSPIGTSNYAPKFKPDDLLMIIITAPDNEASKLFNLPAVSISQNSALATGQTQYQLYLVDNQGYINLPVIGQFKIGGLSREDAMKQLKTILDEKIGDPIINIKITNYKVSVTGEVARPGSYPIVSERITLPDALAMAGDLTIYGQRTNIAVIREIDGVRTINRVDITKADFINSDFYYLSQNDVVYVEPNKTRVNSASVGPNITIGLSALSLVITVVALLIR